MGKDNEGTLCGCGRAGRYTMIGLDGISVSSCNKYKRCPTYDELKESFRVSQSHVLKYRRAVDMIDEYFEYESGCSADRKYVNMVLGNLANGLR